MKLTKSQLKRIEEIRKEYGFVEVDGATLADGSIKVWASYHKHGSVARRIITKRGKVTMS